MGSLPLHPYFNSRPLRPHSSALSSSSTNWSRHSAPSVRIGWGMAVSPKLANQKRWVANNLWDFCTQKSRAARRYLRGPLASNDESNLHPRKRKKTDSEPRTGFQRLTVSERNKPLVGADNQILKRQSSANYGNRSLKENKHVENDVDLIMRLEIVEKLEIDCLLRAFEKSIGSQLQNLSGTQDQTLERFTSQLKGGTKIKLKRSTKIDFVRRPGHILQIKIDDKEIGSIQCEPLCRSLFDLYIGEDPLDK